MSYVNLKSRVNYVELEIEATGARLFPRGGNDRSFYNIWEMKYRAGDISRPETWD
jgi:hypothetical protein